MEYAVGDKSQNHFFDQSVRINWKQNQFGFFFDRLIDSNIIVVKKNFVHFDRELRMKFFHGTWFLSLTSVMINDVSPFSSTPITL